MTQFQSQTKGASPLQISFVSGRQIALVFSSKFRSIQTLLMVVQFSALTPFTSVKLPAHRGADNGGPSHAQQGWGIDLCLRSDIQCEICLRSSECSRTDIYVYLPPPQLKSPKRPGTYLIFKFICEAFLLRVNGSLVKATVGLPTLGDLYGAQARLTP